MNHIIFVVAIALIAHVALSYQPLSPTSGSFTWRLLVNGKSDSFIGGRLMYDYVAGYVRMDSWNDALPHPGINGISVWDLREDTAILTMIGPHLVCQTHRLTKTDDMVPSRDDYSAYKFDSLAYWNRAMAERWVDAAGRYVFTNVFTRDIVGMGNLRNASDPDSQALDYVISDWSDKAPDGTDFLLPNTVKCTEVNASENALPHFMRGLFGPSKGQICNGCKKSMADMITKMQNQMCGGGEEGQDRACAKYYPTMGFCPTMLADVCKKGSLNADGMCKMARLC